MPGEPMRESPVHRLLTPGNCRVVSDDVSIHWFPTCAPISAPCHCGEVVRQDEADDAARTSAAPREDVVG